MEEEDESTGKNLSPFAITSARLHALPPARPAESESGSAVLRLLPTCDPEKRHQKGEFL
jgi:hypothetical protein